MGSRGFGFGRSTVCRLTRFERLPSPKLAFWRGLSEGRAFSCADKFRRRREPTRQRRTKAALGCPSLWLLALWQARESNWPPGYPGPTIPDKAKPRRSRIDLNYAVMQARPRATREMPRVVRQAPQSGSPRCTPSPATFRGPSLNSRLRPCLGSLALKAGQGTVLAALRIAVRMWHRSRPSARR